VKGFPEADWRSGTRFGSVSNIHHLLECKQGDKPLFEDG
jgi:hypothetical protein